MDIHLANLTLIFSTSNQSLVCFTYSFLIHSHYTSYFRSSASSHFRVQVHLYANILSQLRRIHYSLYTPNVSLSINVSAHDRDLHGRCSLSIATNLATQRRSETARLVSLWMLGKTSFCLRPLSIECQISNLDFKSLSLNCTVALMPSEGAYRNKCLGYPGTVVCLGYPGTVMCLGYPGTVMCLGCIRYPKPGYPITLFFVIIESMSSQITFKISG